MQYLIDTLVTLAALEYRRDLVRSWARKDWGFEVSCYVPEIDTLIDAWKEKYRAV